MHNLAGWEIPLYLLGAWYIGAGVWSLTMGRTASPVKAAHDLASTKTPPSWRYVCLARVAKGIVICAPAIVYDFCGHSAFAATLTAVIAFGLFWATHIFQRIFQRRGIAEMRLEL